MQGATTYHAGLPHLQVLLVKACELPDALDSGHAYGICQDESCQRSLHKMLIRSRSMSMIPSADAGRIFRCREDDISG